MKCECGCGEEADSVLETQASGVSFLCELCADQAFIHVIANGVAEHVHQS